MGGEDDGRPCSSPIPEDRCHCIGAHRIEPAEGLVEDEQLGVVYQRGGELGALLVAVGESLDPLVEAIAEPEPGEPGTCGVSGVGGAHPTQPSEPDELLGGLHLRVQTALLGHVPEPDPRLWTDSFAVPSDRTAVEGHQAEHRAHRGGLARSVWPEEAEDSAPAGCEGRSVQREDIAVLFVETFEFQHRTMLAGVGCEGKPPVYHPGPMARVGILGLPNVGKSTLFNALTGLSAPTAAHPFSTTEPNVGVARVPDERLDRAAELEQSDKTVHAALDLLDLPAMAGQGGGGFGPQFIGRLREMEALAVVLRAFHDESVPDGESGTDPVAQAETLLLELTLADAEVFRRRADKAAKEAMSDQSLKPVAAAVGRAADHLESGMPLRSTPWNSQELAAFRDLAPLTFKPAVWVVNVDEGAEVDPADVAAVVPEGDLVVVLSARIEEEATQLDPADRTELLEGLGLGEGALATMVRAIYDALGLVSFFTVGPKESRAWTVRRGAAAPEAAGKIHSDLERGFIRAEVAPIEAVLDAGGWDAAKAAGAVRLEGKDYVVAEGDVIVVRFSV